MLQLSCHTAAGPRRWAIAWFCLVQRLFFPRSESRSVIFVVSSIVSALRTERREPRAARRSHRCPPRPSGIVLRPWHGCFRDLGQATACQIPIDCIDWVTTVSSRAAFGLYQYKGHIQFITHRAAQQSTSPVGYDTLSRSCC